MRATIREALEHVHGVAAVEALAHDSKKRAQGQQQPQLPTGLPSGLRGRQCFLGGMDLSDLASQSGEITTRRGAEAAKIADTPHLIGDAEWDALELAETDPSKPPLKIVG